MDARLTWNANTESDLAGYLLYHGTASLVYIAAHTTQVSALTTELTFTFLDVGTTHYFNIKAFDASGNPSDYGGEVTKFEPYPAHASDERMEIQHPPVLAFRDTAPAEWMAGYIAEAVGLNVPPPPPPPIFERIPIGGFMVV